MLRFTKDRLAGLMCLTVLVNCGGGATTPTPPPPPQQPPAANRAPILASVTATPSFGIMGVTTFNFAAQASDPDGDPLTYTWDIAGNARTGTPITLSFSNGAPALASVTVTDGRGGNANGSAHFIIGSMTGRWVGAMPGFALVYDFTQSPAGLLTATFAASSGAVTVGGTLDPAAANTINANGRVTFRSKVTTVGVNDYTITGDMDTTGVRFTGSVSGSGLNGPVVLVKQ